jgi:hypothetical protein
MDDAATRRTMSLTEFGRRLADDLDRSLVDLDQPRHRQERRALSGSVRSQQGNDLARVHVQAQIADDGHSAIADVQIGDRED